MTFDDFLDRHAEWLVSRGRRPATVRGYRSDLAKLEMVVKKQGLTPQALSKHLTWINSLTGSTRARHLAALRSFLRWYNEQHLEAGSPKLSLPLTAAGAYTPAKLPGPGSPRALDLAAVAQVMAVIPRQADRDQLFFGLLRYLGLRPGEALALHVDNFARRSDHLSVPGRGGRPRVILVNNTDIRLRLEHWVRNLGRSEGPMFAGPDDHEAVSYQAMLKRWGRYCNQVGVRVRLGDLRQTHHDELLADGIPLWVVGERLGIQSFAVASHGDGPASDPVISAWETTKPAASPNRYASPRAASQ